MVTDPVSDFIIRIKNAGAVHKETVSLPYSKLKHAIADVLLKKGYISSVEKKGKKIKKTLAVGLVYKEGNPRISGVTRISKLSKRTYYNAKEIKPVKNGIGSLILSTPKGVMTGEEAKKNNMGGEALFKIW